MKNKFLLYVGTRPLILERQAEIAAAARNGYELVLADSSSKAYADFTFSHFIQTDLLQEEKAFNDILTYIEQHALSISGVVGWTDPSVMLVARLAQALGLPGTLPEHVHNVRNKSNTRRLLAEHLPEVNPKFVIVEDSATLTSAIDEIGFPCILKPSGSSGGRGITRIHTAEQVTDQLAVFLQTVDPKKDVTFGFYQNEILVEQEIIGTEHSVAGMVIDNQVIVMAIIDKLNDTQWSYQYQNMTPSLLPSEIQQQLMTIAQRAIPLTGINQCGFHIDIMVSHQGQIKILEIGGRLGGECINSHLIPLACPELNPYDCLIKTVTGNSPLLKNQWIYDARFKASSRALLPTHTGYVSSLTGLETLKNNSVVKEFAQLIKKGEISYAPEEKFYALAVVYLIAQSDLDTDINQLLNEIAEQVIIEIQ